MIQSLKIFFAVLIPMIVLDGIWLTLISKSFYSKHLGGLLSANPVLIAIVLFYVMYAIGVVYFIVAPALAGSLPWYQVLLRGAFFGLIAYGTYDLTNHATVVNWPTIITVVDMAWGMVVTGAASVIGYFILK